ncbi:MAG: hypothetical protein KDK45_08965, partial [Leptospiraceae bacterium]|nr:hypothetical protein [Leptospiraceae bacterium]
MAIDPSLLIEYWDLIFPPPPPNMTVEEFTKYMDGLLPVIENIQHNSNLYDKAIIDALFGEYITVSLTLYNIEPMARELTFTAFIPGIVSKIFGYTVEQDNERNLHSPDIGLSLEPGYGFIGEINEEQRIGLNEADYHYSYNIGTKYNSVLRQTYYHFSSIEEVIHSFTTNPPGTKVKGEIEKSALELGESISSDVQTSFGEVTQAITDLSDRLNKALNPVPYLDTSELNGRRVFAYQYYYFTSLDEVDDLNEKFHLLENQLAEKLSSIKALPNTGIKIDTTDPQNPVLVENKPPGYSLYNHKHNYSDIEGTPPSGGSAKPAEYPFSNMSSITINHKLGYYPHIEVLINNKIVLTDVEHVDKNNVKVDFSSKQT